MRFKLIEKEIHSPESIGKQPKYWIKSYGKKFLFKLTTFKNDGTPIYNDVSECMAADIANLLELPVAKYYLCEDNGKNGVITLDFLNNDLDGPKEEELFDGVYLISQIDPGFKNGSLLNPKTHQYYTVDLIIRTIEKYGLIKDVLNMLVYDALIANRDRNPSNYGIIVNHKNNTIRFAPLYDNGASLGISMVDHRLAKCIDSFGMIVDEKHLDVVVHKHIVGKVTLERFSQYKEKNEWDKLEIDRIMNLIEEKKRELLPLVEEGKFSRTYYHKILTKIGDGYRKYDITKLEYQSLISYLTLYYPDEIEEIMNNIAEKITPENIDIAFDYYKDELPKDRLKMAKEIVLKRAKWMTKYYFENKYESRGKLL